MPSLTPALQISPTIESFEDEQWPSANARSGQRTEVTSHG